MKKRFIKKNKKKAPLTFKYHNIILEVILYDI